MTPAAGVGAGGPLPKYNTAASTRAMSQCQTWDMGGAGSDMGESGEKEGDQGG